ncbi:MAG: wax ester/triacylglycerol synthase family O-acyltransferase [Maricaulaceae bacterium]
MEQVQGLDATFVALESSAAPVHIGSIMIYDPSTAPDGFVRFKDIIEFVDNRLQLSKTLRQKLVKVPFGVDYPYWVQDSNFDLEYHIRHLALPKPGDWRQLCILAARIFARPLDLSRPPWEMTVIGGLDNIEGVPKGSYAVISKVHHAAIDGMSGIDLMRATHTLHPTREPLDTLDPWQAESNPSQIELFARGCLRASALPIRQGKALAQSAPGFYRAVKGFIQKDFDFKAVMETPKTRFGGCVSPHRVFGSKAFNLDDIQKMRGMAEGAKMNDVMLSITGGAMRHYLEAKGELPDTSVTAMAPISVRQEQEKDTMGNQVAAMFVPLGSHIKSIEDRMAYVVDETKKAKSLTHAMGARQMAEMAKLSPNFMMNIGTSLMQRFKLADKTKAFVNTVVTNVPGPPIPLYSAGAQAVGIYGMFCLMDGIRLGHVVQTYQKGVSLSFTACRQAMPDPGFYDKCIQKSYDDHEAALKAHLKASKPKNSSKPASKTVKVLPQDKLTKAKKPSSQRTSTHDA